MKQLHFILQSKGGVGKSFLVWLLANQQKDNQSVIFIDLDNSTQTSNARLNGLVGPNRVSHYSILDENKKIEREEFLNMLQVFAQAPVEKIYVDFGAPESEEFLKFLRYEFSAETLKEAADMLEVSISFNVVIAGNDTVSACLNYSQALTSLTQDFFAVHWFYNVGLSGGIDSRDTTKAMLEMIISTNGLKTQLIPFGDLGFSQSSKDIVKMLADGSTPEALSFASKLKFNQVMKEFQNALSHV
ncbi:hypothetical protein P1X15_29800 [Runella sp. MFBS21]|uniref:hypothetical protein n=1 Tax=Runella sp. MFBS21 TaxID=3034018 RepID=UPI0023F62FC4|nr:hypothetical protein [Runella sp. MFBS21]MDF7821847.1 hypothetical protein [Runella sp. MFBS21]